MVRNTAHLSADMATEALFARLKVEFEKLQKTESHVKAQKEEVEESQRYVGVRKRAITDRESIVTLKETSAQEIAKALAAQQKDLEQRKSLISSHEALNSRQAALQEAEAALARDREHLARGEELISIREEEVAEREEYVASRGQDQVQRETAITNKEAELAEKAEKWDEELDQLRCEAEEISHLERRLDDFQEIDEQLTAYEESARLKDQRIAQLSELADRNDAELDHLASKVQQKDREVQDLRSQAKKHDKDAILYDEELRKSHQKAVEMQESLDQKDEKVELLEGQIDSLKNDILNLKQEHKQKFGSVQAASDRNQNRIFQQIQDIYQKDNHIAILKSEISSDNKQLRQKDTELKNLRAEMKKIENRDSDRSSERLQNILDVCDLEGRVDAKEKDVAKLKSLLDELNLKLPQSSHTAQPYSIQSFTNQAGHLSRISDHLDGHYHYQVQLSKYTMVGYQAFARVPEDKVNTVVRDKHRTDGHVLINASAESRVTATLEELLAVDTLHRCNVYRLLVKHKGQKYGGICRVPCESGI